MNRLPALLCLFPLFAGCDAGGKALITPPDQLEALTVETGDFDDFEPFSKSGALAVEGADGDFTLTFTPTEGEALVIPVHSPAGTDLSALAGEERTLHLLRAEVFEQRSVAISDADGVMWVGDIGANADEVGTLLGVNPPVYGDVRATAEDDNFSWTYVSVLFSGEDGTVELQPGDVLTLPIGGAIYKVTLIAAFDRTVKDSAVLPGCPFLEDLLSYELERVATAEEASVKVRPEGLSEARVGCGE